MVSKFATKNINIPDVSLASSRPPSFFRRRPLRTPPLTHFRGKKAGIRPANPIRNGSENVRDTRPSLKPLLFSLACPNLERKHTRKQSPNSCVTARLFSDSR